MPKPRCSVSTFLWLMAGGALVQTLAFGQAADVGVGAGAGAGAGAGGGASQGDVAGQSVRTSVSAAQLLIAGGEASLDFGGFLQTRYIANARSDVGDNQEWTHGFSTRRARLGARGQLNKQLGFSMSGEIASGRMVLFDSFATWRPSGAWLVKVGQFKQNLLREDMISDTQQPGVEKSTVGSIFSQERSQGVDAIWTGETTRFSLGLHDGLRTLNTDFASVAESDYAVCVSGEWKWEGSWQQLDDFVGFEGKPYAGSVRGAINWEDGGETGETLDESLLAYTIDAIAKGDGWNAFASFMGRRIEAGTSEFDDLGLLVQSGAFFAQDWDVYARYGLVLPDDDRTNGEDFGEVTLGVNHYLVPESHAAKLSMDATWAMDDQAGSSSLVRPSASNGLLAAPDDHFYVRVQFQIAF